MAPRATASLQASLGIPAGPLGQGRWTTSQFAPALAFTIPPEDAGTWRGTGETPAGFALQASGGAIGFLSLAGTGVSAAAAEDALLRGLDLDAQATTDITVDRYNGVVLDAATRTSGASFDLGPNPLTFRSGEQNVLIVVDVAPGPLVILFGASGPGAADLRPAFERIVATIVFPDG